MTTINQFPEYPKSKLSEQEVVSYLVDLRSRGWTVFENDYEFIISFGDEKEAIVQPSGDGFNVIAKNFPVPGSVLLCGHAVNILQFERSLAQAAAFHCVSGWPTQPKTVRLSSTEPATNLYKISMLIGTSEILGVFDPYLDNRSLQALSDIASLSGSISPSVRLLSSPKAIQVKHSGPKLTSTFAATWFTEHGCSAGEIRLLSTPGEHRRFILLGGGKSILLGPSLNSLAKNEAASVDSDVQDRAFFDSAWSCSNALPP